MVTTTTSEPQAPTELLTASVSANVRAGDADHTYLLRDRHCHFLSVHAHGDCHLSLEDESLAGETQRGANGLMSSTALNSLHEHSRAMSM